MGDFESTRGTRRSPRCCHTLCIEQHKHALALNELDTEASMARQSPCGMASKGDVLNAAGDTLDQAISQWHQVFQMNSHFFLGQFSSLAKTYDSRHILSTSPSPPFLNSSIKKGHNSPPPSQPKRTYSFRTIELI